MMGTDLQRDFTSFDCFRIRLIYILLFALACISWPLNFQHKMYIVAH